MTKSIKTFLFLAVTLTLTSCGWPQLFQVIINQGNLVDEEMLGKLEVGMTESQVRYVMGTPLVSDTFYPIDGTTTPLLLREKLFIRRQR